MNRLRIEQIVRGALPHDMIAMRIRMTHKLRPPPSFNDLLKDVREEEDMLQGRTDAKSMVMSKPVASVPKPAPENKADPEVEKLKKELREIKAEMNNLKVATVETAATQTEKKPKTDTKETPLLKDQRTTQISLGSFVIDVEKMDTT